MLVGGDRIELLRPLGGRHPGRAVPGQARPGDASRRLPGGGIEHALADAAAAGLELIDEAPRVGLFGLRVAFIHPQSVDGVLVELVEPPRTERAWLSDRGSRSGSRAG